MMLPLGMVISSIRVICAVHPAEPPPGVGTLVGILVGANGTAVEAAGGVGMAVDAAATRMETAIWPNAAPLLARSCQTLL